MLFSEESLFASEQALTGSAEQIAAAIWQDEDDQVSDNHHLVPARLVRVAHRLRQIDDSDDTNTISALSRMKLPQMTGQIRDVEQRALAIQREEGREEVSDSPLLLLHASSRLLSPPLASSPHSSRLLSSLLLHRVTVSYQGAFA